MENKENYIRMLEQKRDTELPEIIKKLQLKLEMRKREKDDIDFEIEHLRATENEKTIFDLPDVASRKITRMLTQSQNDIHSLSLSSDKMTHFLDTIFRENSECIKMEKAFSILLTNFYLDRDDLLNCIETTWTDLGKVASRTWHLLENPNYQLVDGIGAIQHFREKVERTKMEQKVWTCFAGNIIEFNLRDRPSESWNKAKDFLHDYGQFVVNIELYLNNMDLEAAEKADYIHKMLFNGKLPNLQFFKVHAPGPIYGLCPQAEARSQQQYFCLWTSLSCYSVENYKAVLRLPALIAEAWYNTQSRCVIFFKKLKSLIYHVLYEDEKLRKKVIAAQTNGLLQTKELALNPHITLERNLHFAGKFPALSKISFDIPVGNYSMNRGHLMVPRNIQIPTVRTLSYCFYGEGTFPGLQDFFSVFPSLRCFIIKTSFTRDAFVAFMKRVVEHQQNNIDAGNGFEDFDIYQRISNEQPLTESNIWAQVPKLNVLTFITGKLFLDNKLKSIMVEKYTRVFGDGDSIRVEKFMETVAIEFPSL